MPNVLYIGKPKVHTTATLEQQRQHLHVALIAAGHKRTPPVTAEKMKLLADINAELALRG